MLVFINKTGKRTYVLALVRIWTVFLSWNEITMCVKANWVILIRQVNYLSISPFQNHFWPLSLLQLKDLSLENNWLFFQWEGLHLSLSYRLWVGLLLSFMNHTWMLFEDSLSSSLVWSPVNISTSKDFVNLESSFLHLELGYPTALSVQSSCELFLFNLYSTYPISLFSCKMSWNPF